MIQQPLLLHINPDKTILQKDTQTHMFIAELFMIAMIQKHSSCLWTDKWTKKLWYMYTMEYYSTIKKNEIMSFAATWMDQETIVWSEVSQTPSIIWYHFYVESNGRNEPGYKIETELQT